MVVTGTLFSGRIHLDERAVLQPKDVTARVRGIQVHGENVNRSDRRATDGRQSPRAG